MPNVAQGSDTPQVPVIGLVFDLPDSTLQAVSNLFVALERLWDTSMLVADPHLETGGDLPPPAHPGYGTLRSSLRVQGIRLASPLEVVLTGVASQIAPIGYVIAGLAVMERSVRLLMDWQKHRVELANARKSTIESAELAPVPNDANRDVDREEITELARWLARQGLDARAGTRVLPLRRYKVREVRQAANDQGPME